MYSRAIRHTVTQTPQTQPSVPSQVPNNAGGYSFQTSVWDQLDRFLIIGSLGGTFYVKESDLTQMNLDAIILAIREDGRRVIKRIIDVSTQGLAAKNEAAILALALVAVHGSETAKSQIKDALPKVCRTATMLFHYAEYHKVLGKGWGRGTRKAVARWYNSKRPEELVYQMRKYPQRDGWSHKDLLALSHANPPTADHKAAYMLAVKGQVPAELSTTQAFDKWVNLSSALQPGLSVNQIVQRINLFSLEREFLPTEALKHPAVWAALLPNMGGTALLRNLGNLASHGLLVAGSPHLTYVQSRLADAEWLKRNRIHPLAILQAFAIYRTGHGLKGDKTWEAIPQVLDALNDAFYLAFASVVPTGKPLSVWVDVSGSMRHQSNFIESLQLFASQLAVALAIVIAGTEPNTELMAFDTQAYRLNFSKRQRLDDIMNNVPVGKATDISVPVRYLTEQKQARHILTLTDSETWAGNVHVREAIKVYRRDVFSTARLINVAMTANNVSNIESDDWLSLETVGFSSDVPMVVSQFINGDF